MPVIAITNHSPEQVMALLRKDDPEIQVTFPPLKSFLDPDRQKHYHNTIFIVGTKEYDRNALAIRAMPNKLVFVFGNNSMLKYYGLESCSDLKKFVSNARPRLAPVGSYLNDLISLTIEGSLFHKLMTYIYTLPSKTHQKPLTHLVCAWIQSGKPLSDLDDMLDELSSKIKISTKLRENIKGHMRKPVTARLRAAFNDLRDGKCITLGEASVRHDVQCFELSYIHGNLTKAANITDKYVGNHGV